MYDVYSREGDLMPSAYCDMRTDGGGWLVLLRRKDGSVDFDRTWDAYGLKIGNLLGEFWYGLIKMSRFTLRENHELRVDLEDWDGNTPYAKYSHFRVLYSGQHTFMMTIGGYSGTAGDALSSANDMAFTTRDSDNDMNADGNCAANAKGGWWFENCFQDLLTGPYSHTPHGGRGIVWSTWKGFSYSLKSCEMKIRPSESPWEG